MKSLLRQEPYGLSLVKYKMSLGSSSDNMFFLLHHCALWNIVLHSNTIQYFPRNMHTVFALLCFVVVIHWLIFPYPSGLLHWHCGNLTIAPVPAKQPWWIWINTSCEFIMNDCITTTKQSTTKPCAYFLGYTVSVEVNHITLTLKMLDFFSMEHKYQVVFSVIFQRWDCVCSWKSSGSWGLVYSAQSILWLLVSLPQGYSGCTTRGPSQYKDVVLPI